MFQTFENILALIPDKTEFARHLPSPLPEIARLVGFEAMMLLADKHAGLSVYIQPHPTEHSAVAKLIGLENAVILSDYYAQGHAVNVRMPVAIGGRVLRRMVGIALLKEGRAVRGIAVTLGVGYRTVYDWKDIYVRDYVRTEPVLAQYVERDDA